MDLLELLKNYPCRYRANYAISKEHKDNMLNMSDDDWKKIIRRELMLSLADKVMEKLEINSAYNYEFKMIDNSIECFVFTKDEMMAFIKVIEDVMYAERQKLMDNKSN